MTSPAVVLDPTSAQPATTGKATAKPDPKAKASSAGARPPAVRRRRASTPRALDEPAKVASPRPAETAQGPAIEPEPAVTMAPALAPSVEASTATLAPAALPPRDTPGFAFQAVHAVSDAKVSTGVDRLDLLLGGGYAPGSATLLFGPAFCGKQQLLQHAVLRAARDGLPVTLVVHTIGAEAMSARLKLIDPAFAAAEEAGRVRYVDVHSRFLGEPTTHPNTIYIEDPHDLPAMLKALELPRRTDGARPAPSLLAIESASTVLIDLGATKAFTFLRTVLGRTLTAGGVGLLCLEGGMHPDSEVQMAKHLCAGMIEMRKKGEAYCLHVEGLETAFTRPGWVEYEFSNKSFKVTGSFASRSIL
jgi:KaiC/GvpD/RAD55 family RecA-like ATPase